MTKQKIKEPEDINPEAFDEIEYVNEDVDTDRGLWRQRYFNIWFKTHCISLSEEDFDRLTRAMEKYVDMRREEAKLNEEEYQNWRKQWEQKKISRKKSR